MSKAGVFSGSALTSMDAKGRVSIPASLRNSIPGDPASKSLYITAPTDCPYLLVAGSALRELNMERLDREEELAAMRGERFDREAAAQDYFGSGEIVPMDTSGRFVLPDILFVLGEFEGSDLFCFSVGTAFQLWCLKRLMANDDPQFANVRRMATGAITARERKASRA